MKSAPGLMLAMMGFVMVGALLKTTRLVPVSLEREVSS